MAKVITGKKINLSQLDKELDLRGLCADENDLSAVVIVTADDSNITQAELEAAIAAHIAIDDNAVREADKAVLLAKLGITADEAKLLLS